MYTPEQWKEFIAQVGTLQVLPSTNATLIMPILDRGRRTTTP